MVNKLAIVALHRHFVTADAIRQFISADVPVDDKTARMLGEDLSELAEFFSAVFRLQVFYALLYVVVEGYQELGCEDPAVDELLAQSDLVGALKRFRNGTFHFQREPLTSPKVEEFMDIPGSDAWTFNLFRALKSFFEKHLRIPEIMEGMSGLPLEEQMKVVGEQLKGLRQYD
jgi:hypothetical protein